MSQLLQRLYSSYTVYIAMCSSDYQTFHFQCMFYRSTLQCQNVVSAEKLSLKAFRGTTDQLWGRAGWGASGGFFLFLFFTQWLHCVGKSANSAATFSWHKSLQLPRLPTTEKNELNKQAIIRLLLFFCTLLFDVSTGTKNNNNPQSMWKLLRLWWMHMSPSIYFQMYDVLGTWINIHSSFMTGFVQGRWRGVGERRTCSEEEHGHCAVVLPLCPPAEGNEGHQKRHQSWHGTGPQEHQRGNLPVCSKGTRRLERSIPLTTQKLDSRDNTGELKRCADKH